MEYYARYSFKKQGSTKCFMLENQEGEVQNLHFAKFADTKKNQEQGIVGKEYMLFTLPRSPAMRKYFAYVFEHEAGKPITSTEGLNGLLRTFGDGKKLGNNDLILFQFSEDLSSVDVYFVADKGATRADKRLNFDLWCSGLKLKKSS